MKCLGLKRAHFKNKSASIGVQKKKLKALHLPFLNEVKFPRYEEWLSNDQAKSYSTANCLPENFVLVYIVI